MYAAYLTGTFGVASAFGTTAFNTAFLSSFYSLVFDFFETYFLAGEAFAFLGTTFLTGAVLTTVYFYGFLETTFFFATTTFLGGTFFTIFLGTFFLITFETFLVSYFLIA